MMRPFLQCGWLPGLLLLLPGCGGREAAVSGRATLDGKPLARGTVVFTPVGGGPVGYGTIGSGGEYAVSVGAGKGLAAGEYVVSVASYAEAEEGLVRGPGGAVTEAAPTLTTPEAYASPETSPLRATVVPGANRVPLELQSP